MTTTYNTDWLLSDLHTLFSEALERIVYARIRTLKTVPHLTTKAHEDRLYDLITVLTFNQIITMPGEGTETADLETRIGQTIETLEDQESGSIGVSQYDLLKFELKELSYIFASQIDKQMIHYYFEQLCISESERVHYDSNASILFKTMVIVAVLIKTSNIYNTLAEIKTQAEKKPRRGAASDV